MADVKSEQELAFPSFWDARYRDHNGDEPSHEWFKSFDSLQPFFNKHLLESKGPDTNPRILHLGSGDSVS